MWKRKPLEIIPLPLIPLPVPGLPKKKTAGKKMGAKKFLFLYFCPHLFAFLFSVGQPFLSQSNVGLRLPRWVFALNSYCMVASKEGLAAGKGQVNWGHEIALVGRI
jgi:hypothetical protein